MKRNSKFLLLLALIMSGIIGVYFISCGGDEITNPPPPDKVIGSVHGVVTNDINNTPLEGVTVAWVNKGETHTATSDALGYFVTDGVLGSGDYVFTFSVNGYSVRRTTTVIPDIDSLRGEPGTPVSGDIPFSRELNVDLFPMTASLTGKVFTALPSTAPGKETETGLAADDPPPDYLAPASDVTVHILFDTLYPYDWYDVGDQSKDDQQGQALNGWGIPLNISPDRYQDETDGEGVYLFENLPAVTGGWLRVYTDPYQKGDTLYCSDTTYVQLLPNATVTAPDIFTPVGGSEAFVMNTNFETGKFKLDSNLIVAFSKEMDTATVSVVLTENCPPNRNMSFSLTWSNENRLLTIDPTFKLVPDCNYYIRITGKAVDGNSLATFTKTFPTINGMRFVSTNLDDFSGSQFTFCDFPLDANIEICFDMVPNLTNPNTSIVLYDLTAGREIDVATSVNGNCFIINPANPLESERIYLLDFKIYSNLSSYDYVADDEATQDGNALQFYAVSTDVTPAKVTGFVKNMSPPTWKADWNTDSVLFKWNAIAGAEWYEIYAKDNHKNTDFIRVATITALSYVTWQTGSVDFNFMIVDSTPTPWDTTYPNQQFDLYSDDGIITPFSDSNRITFKIRAVGDLKVCGETVQRLEGVFSDSVRIWDETAPSFTVTVCGDADNFVNASQATLNFEITPKLEYCEFANNPTYSFAEAGGDPAYVLPGSAVTSWTWDADVRDGSGKITVPANMMAAADTFTVKIKDNSGNEGTANFRLLPIIEFDHPYTSDTTFEAPQGTIDWLITEAWNSDCTGLIDINHLDIYISWDGGTTWIDTILNWAVGSNPRNYSVPDTLIVNGTAKIGLANNAGGYRWLSQSFTVNGIKLTSPDSLTYFDITDTIFDAGNTDSTVIPVAWNSTSFISEVEIAYKVKPAPPKNAVTWIPVDTVANTGTYNFYAPSHGYDYDLYLRVADADSDGHPRDTLRWWIHIFHDSVKFSDPAGEEYCVDGGSTVFNIRWWNRYNGSWILDILPSLLDIDYAVDAQNDTNWIQLVNNTANDCFHTWDTVPYRTATDYALLRILTQDSTVYVSDFFGISGLKITSPNGSEDWDVGSEQTIVWDNYCGFDGNVDIEYSTNNGTTWSSIASNTANNGWYDWIIPNIPSTQCLIRIKENGVAIQRQDVSDNVFTIAGIIVTYPNAAADRWLAGRDDSVKWSVVGIIGQTVAIDFSIDSGVTYPYNVTNVGVSASGLFQFAVPPLTPPFPYTKCRVKVRDITGDAVDTSNALFKIDQPHITVIAPSDDTVSWQMGTAHNITWDTAGIRSTSLDITLDTSSGGDGYPIPIATVAVPAGSYLWNIPDLGPNDITTCKIRVSEVGIPTPLRDESDFDFTIRK